MDKYSKFTLVEHVMDVFDENRVWFYIPNYNGYELSNDGYIRSMKHWRKYPFGLIIRPDKNGYYELSNNQNKRVKVKMEEILELIKNNPYHVTGYPRKTYMVDRSSRNQAYFIKDKQPKPQPDNTVKHAKFTIIKEN